MVPAIARVSSPNNSAFSTTSYLNLVPKFLILAMLSLTVSCINVNSLNMSALNKPANLEKIYGILKLKTDITFLSDIRLSNKNNVSCSDDLCKILKQNPYGNFSALLNSTKNKRGVGIIYKDNLSISVEARRDDPGENFVLARIRIQGNTVIIGAIYGPNDRDENFFRTLRHELLSLGNFPIIIGGDFNATYSNLPVNVNPDCLNMTSLPNLLHSNCIADLCTNLTLYDPFRFLYPEARAFSYQPRAFNATNRSRIDFFLVSGSLLEGEFDCKIADSVQSSMFDHKAVIFNLGNNNTNKKFRQTISTKILSDPDMDIIIDLSIKEVYLIYQDRQLEEKRQLLQTLGSLRARLKEAGPCNKYYHSGTVNEDREEIINNIRLTLGQDRIQFIPEHQLNIDDDIFFEMILNHVRNDIFSYQSFVFRYCKKDKAMLCEQLDGLRDDPNANFQEIKQLEDRLRLISERDIRNSLQNHPVFEMLHAEKMTPLFLKLAKGCNKNDRLSNITLPDLTPFNNDTDRNEFIVNFFENIYKVPDDAPVNFDGCIERFLGPDICQHPVVTNSKLTAEEAATLNNPITLQELDNSVAKAKTNSAGGQDGFNNTFIKKYWKFFRNELYNYSLCCFRKGRLTDNFRSASVRLIPKKGDTRLLKNWRPISLLSCFYKVISRAINERLKKVSDIFCSRAQKGFTSSRYIHEVLLNVSENIAYCNNTGTTGAIISIDQAKAFDTIYHGFVRASYKFFGVNDEFLNMMDTLGTNRRACIILDGGEHSRYFDLGTGRPQGDCVSPQQFNTGDQILLFRIELDPGIASIYTHLQVPRNKFPIPIQELPREFKEESQGETDKVDGFADDATGSTLFDLPSLQNTKRALDEFAAISGLKCNYDKTNVMQVGPVKEITREFLDLGFNFTNEISLLGFKLNKSGIMTDNLFQEITEKIVRLITVWDRYRLSFPGRINVCKSLLISQISYAGSIITPPEDILTRLQELLDNFCLGGLKISKDRIYLPPSEGGAGLINLKHFLIGLQSSWILRANTSTRDVWRLTVRDLSSGNCFTANNLSFDNLRHPILSGLVESFCFFRDRFYDKDDNFRSSFVLNNPIVRRGDNQNRMLDIDFFNNCGVNNDELTLGKLVFSDLVSNNTFKSYADITANTGINLNLVLYFRLRHAIMSFLGTRLRKKSDGTCVSLSNFFKIKYSPSRKIRLFLDNLARKSTLAQLRTTKTFLRLTELNNVNFHFRLGSMLAIWNMNNFTNKFREFCFKFFNNQLSINTRLAHFVQGQARTCGNCLHNGIAQPQDETFLHLFLDCPVAANIHESVLRQFFPRSGTGRENKKAFFFTGTAIDQSYPHSIIFLVSGMVTQFILWETKLQKKRISAATATIDFKFIMFGIIKGSSFLRDEIIRTTGDANIFWREICNG
jgi:exonuclease III